MVCIKTQNGWNEGHNAREQHLHIIITYHLTPNT